MTTEENGFENLDISDKNVDALKDLDIDTPTPVQEKAIPLILEGANIMAQSKTGTGKTFAYLIPIIDKLKYIKNECLIIVPVRELAKQVKKFVKDLGHKDLRVMTIYGGVSINNQIRKLKRGVNIIVGTPGRLIDLYKRRELNLNNLRFVVLDEADRLLDMGFLPDVKYILDSIKSNYQFLLFSATLEYKLKELVKKYTNSDFKYLDLSRDDMTVENTEQYYYMINHFKEKYGYFRDIIKKERPKTVLVFINTKKTGNWLFNKLKHSNMGYRIGYISGDLSQHKREQVLKRFRSKEINMLIATDVAARGLDISNISHVINYDLPRYPENYVHRIGRTSRMNKIGKAITLCLESEYEYLCRIEGLINREIKRKTLPSRQKRNDGNRFPVGYMY
ncbi:MAG: DEAD/DEAH box helicase [Candidatus Lokiarchaeota archaeon]|nr:DEAD/DEAH box helicase [Candidatus Lokiarchaeota archaeon]MBD3199361.1 DEAD/DEAH box helicase [Candidatus Lokiarchaeota archaeon]